MRLEAGVWVPCGSLVKHRLFITQGRKVTDSQGTLSRYSTKVHSQLPGLIFPISDEKFESILTNTLWDSSKYSWNNSEHGKFVGSMLLEIVLLFGSEKKQFCSQIADFVEKKWSETGFQEFIG